MWFIPRPRRRPTEDRGVAQAAQVGLLIGLSMTIMLAVVPMGPAIGGSVARLFICTLGGDGGARCVTPHQGGDTGALGADDPAPVTVGPDSVSDLDVADCAAAGGQLDTLFPDGRWSSTALDALGAGIDTGVPASPGNTVGGGTWQLDGCRLSVSADRNAAANSTWTSIWHSVVAGIVGATSAGVAYVTCAALAGPALPACGAVAGFTIGFVWNIVGPALDGELDYRAVLKAFLIGLLAAIPAGFAFSLDAFATETVGPILRAIGQGIRNGIGRSWGWIQRAAGASVNRIAGWLEYAADWMAQHGAQVPPDPAPAPVGLPGTVATA
jgi:hypothetical protein